MISAAFLGKSVGYGGTWGVVFSTGAALVLTYLVLALLAMLEGFRKVILNSNRNKFIVLGSIYWPILAALVFWTVQVGSVEALPIFPAFLVIFHAWILLQAYFIASPVTQALTRVEDYLASGGLAKRVARGLSVAILFLPAAPLVFGVWVVANWLTGLYQAVPNVSGIILTWTIGLIIGILITYFMVLNWAWPVVRKGRTHVAVFVGGTFTLVWSYLVYRATSMVMGYVSQTQPVYAVLDIGLMVLSILGAAQTFAGRLVHKAGGRITNAFPFLVFAFGTIYAVAQLYFILQIPVTRVDLSIFINGTVFASGIAIMMLFIRRHLSAASPTVRGTGTLPSSVDSSTTEPSP